MHAAADEFRALEAADGEFDIAGADVAYQRYIAALEANRPPAQLADAHADIARACEAMLGFIRDEAAQKRLAAQVRPIELEAAAGAGTAAYRRLQAEADALGLAGLWFL